MERVDDVAAAIVAEFGSLEPMKLQKLVYYSQAWSLVRTGEPLFADRIEAWRDGPVVDSLYQQHAGMREIIEWPAGDPRRLAPIAREIVGEVVVRYGAFDSRELSAMTHAERPWLDARGDLAESERSRAVIATDEMRRFYTQQALHGRHAVNYAIANTELEGIVVPPGFHGVLEDVADGRRNVDDVVAEIIASYSTK